MRYWLPKHSKIMKTHDFPYKNVQFFSTYFSEDWKSFLNGSERFISTSLVSRVKIMIPPDIRPSGGFREIPNWPSAPPHSYSINEKVVRRKRNFFACRSPNYVFIKQIKHENSPPQADFF